jgi:hypothetical protein
MSYTVEQALEGLHTLWAAALGHPEKLVLGVLLFAFMALLYKTFTERRKVKKSMVAHNGTNAHDEVDVDSLRSASGYTNGAEDEEEEQEEDEGSYYSEGSRADSDTLSCVSGVSTRSGRSTASRRSSRSAAAARKSSFRKMSK